MSEVTLLRTSGKDADSVAKYVAAIAKRSLPLLAWAEPEPTALKTDGTGGRIDGFQPLVAGVPPWSGYPPLIEARLFWADAALHVLAEENGGCRWVRIEEIRLEEEAAPTRPIASPEEGKVKCTWRETPVLTLRDAARFGLETATWPTEKLQAVEYHQGGRLVAWRIELKQGERQ